MSIPASVWEALAHAGGGVALSFLVALALGICALTLLFVGSAVVVLERFARAARSPLRAAVVTVVWGAIAALLLLDTVFPELRGEPLARQLPVLARLTGGTILGIALLEILVGLLLRWIAPATLAAVACVMLAAGYALLVGGIDRLGYAIAPAAVIGLALFLVVRRRRHQGRAAGEGERLLLVLGVVLALGIAVPLRLEGPAPEVARAGSALLQVFAAFVLGGLAPLAVVGFLETRGSAEWFVATRYLFAKRRQTFISVITAICVAGVAAGVWLIITVLSVMNGFERTWRDEIIGNRAHFTVHGHFGPIDDWPAVVDVVSGVDGVLGASPYVEAEGMVRGRQGEIVGVRVRGIDPARIGSVTDLREDLQPGSEGALEDLEPRAEGEDPGLLVGSQLAAAIGLEVGDSVMLISPFGGPPTPLGPGPRLTRFRIAGVFQSSFFQYDEVYTFTTLEAAQGFRRMGDVVHGVEVRTTDFYRSQRVAEAVEAALDYQYFTRDWKEFFPEFFQALKNERVMMFVLLTMIMVVAAFAIVVTLVMMIMEKTADIAILKAMGATDATVERIFAIEGTLIGVLGAVLGVIGGIVVTTRLDWVQAQVELWTGIDALPAAIYQLGTLPYELDVGQIGVVTAIALVLALGATLLPSRHGARLEPAEALRSE